MKFIRTDSGKYIYHFAFYGRFELIGLDMDGIEFREPEFFRRLTIHGLHDGFAVRDMTSDCCIPFAGLDILTHRSLLKIYP